MAEEQPVTRAGFFSWLKSKAGSGGLSAAQSGLFAFLETKEAIEGPEEKWVSIGRLDELGIRPRQLYSGGQPVYVLKKDDKVFAFLAVCPGDKNFVRWSHAQNCFICIVCNMKFDLDGGSSEDGQKKLLTVPTRVQQEVVYIKVM